MLLFVLIVLAADGGVVITDGGLPPPGEYWVVRQGRAGAGSSSGFPGPDGGPPQIEFSWDKRCDRVRLDARSLELEGGEVSFSVTRGQITAPTVTSRFRATARATGTCHATWPSTPFFASYDACATASPPSLVKHCVGSSCEWVSDPPWRLEPCEDELLRLRGSVGVALEPTHAEALRTLTRFEQTLAKGGVLFVHPGCEPLKIAPRDAEGFNELDTANLAGTWHARGQLEPLFGLARYSTSFGSTDGGGSWGQSMGSDPILLGKEQLFLGQRLLFFDRQKCRVP